MKTDKDGNPWCDGCGHAHGPLYICEHYSEERKHELMAQVAVQRANLMDPKWREEQKAKTGVTDLELAILGAFAGVDIREEAEKTN